MTWTVLLDLKAQKQLHKIPQADQKRVGGAIEQIRVSPFTGDLQKIQASEDSFRRRVGEYRIVFQIVKSQRLVRVHQILRRTTTTYR